MSSAADISDTADKLRAVQLGHLEWIYGDAIPRITDWQERIGHLETRGRPLISAAEIDAQSSAQLGYIEAVVRSLTQSLPLLSRIKDVADRYAELGNIPDDQRRTLEAVLEDMAQMASSESVASEVANFDRCMHHLDFLFETNLALVAED